MIVKLRSQQIIIDLPRSFSEPWVHLVVQRVEMDENGNELNVVDRWGEVHRKLSDAAMEVYPYQDLPGLPDEHISVYGTSRAITSIALSWIAEKYNGTINERGEVIVEA